MLADFYVDGMWRGEIEPHHTSEQIELIKEYGSHFYKIANGVYTGFSEHYMKPLHDINRRQEPQYHSWWILREFGVFVHDQSMLSWTHQEYELNSLYGVTDTMEQAIMRYRKLFDNVGTVCAISFVPLFRDREVEDGWRWHKNGAYFGDKDPQCEYLRNEPEIDRVISFNIYFVSPFWHEYHDVDSRVKVDSVIDAVREADETFLNFDPKNQVKD